MQSKSKDGFTYYRPVSRVHRDTIYDAAGELLKADFINPIAAHGLHVTLLSRRMLHRPPRLPTIQQALPDSKTRFSATASRPAHVKYGQLKGMKKLLAIVTTLPPWLENERTKTIEHARIGKTALALPNNKYRPHITLGRFIGTEQDKTGFDELIASLETQFSVAFEESRAIALDPLSFRSSHTEWTVKPYASHQKSSRNYNRRSMN